MAFNYTDKPSRSSFVERIWQTVDIDDGIYMAPADGSWDLIFTRENGNVRVLFSGPTSRPTPIPYKAGNTNIGIRFRPGVFMVKVSSKEMLDKIEVLPVKNNETFALLGHTFAIPTFETADMLVEQIEREGLFGEDETIDSALQGAVSPVTNRSVQRHMQQGTGLPLGYHRRIKQAQRAIDLLQKGYAPIQAAHEAGYSDQAHMTRMLKKLTSFTPAEIASSGDPIIVEHLD